MGVHRFVVLFRRLAVLLGLMFWQGGFMFYGAVVVPIGSDVLDSHTMQGFITRRVTQMLNLLGLLALGLWAWELLALRARRSGWLLWGALLLMLGGQFAMWQLLDSFLDAPEMTVLDRAQFQVCHSLYLILSTVQWGIAIGLLAWMIRHWTGSPIPSGPRFVSEPHGGITQED